MKKPPKLNSADEKRIATLVEHFRESGKLFETLSQQLHTAFVGSSELRPFIHSIKSRVKDPEHLRDKLRRKLLEAKKEEKEFSISAGNLFATVNDLVGLRILHLHTEQIQPINAALAALFAEFRYTVIEGPTARTWDDESRGFYASAGIKPIDSPSLYTSVHYVVGANNRSECTFEVQVRTLAEELWGEVDHLINYPHRSDSLACREQIKALARVTSSCTRLVDSIFRSYGDHQEKNSIRKNAASAAA